MANQYEVRLSDGQAYNVTTDQHHANHSDSAFKQHLLDVIKQSAAGIITGVVVGYVHKGRR
jgi:hypothetical protein